MPILVTGATGFIGGALVRRLVDHGKRVRCALRRPVAVRGAETVVVGEIGSQTQWREAVSGMRVVVHLAGVAHLPAMAQSASRLVIGEIPYLQITRRAPGALLEVGCVPQ